MALTRSLFEFCLAFFDPSFCSELISFSILVSLNASDKRPEIFFNIASDAMGAILSAFLSKIQFGEHRFLFA